MAGAVAAGGFVTRAFELMLKECAIRKYTALQTAIQTYIDNGKDSGQQSSIGETNEALSATSNKRVELGFRAYYNSLCSALGEDLVFKGGLHTIVFMKHVKCQLEVAHLTLMWHHLTPLFELCNQETDIMFRKRRSSLRRKRGWLPSSFRDQKAKGALASELLGSDMRMPNSLLHHPIV